MRIISASGHGPGRVFAECSSGTWPGGCKAAVCLTYDNGLDCNLDAVVPDLDKSGLKGGFYHTVSSSTLETLFVSLRCDGEIPDSVFLSEGRKIPCIRIQNATTNELINFTEDEAETGSVAVFSFQAVGTDRFAISRKAHAEFLNYLVSHGDIYWTDTFLNVSKYIAGK